MKKNILASFLVLVLVFIFGCNVSMESTENTSSASQDQSEKSSARTELLTLLATQVDTTAVMYEKKGSRAYDDTEEETIEDPTYDLTKKTSLLEKINERETEGYSVAVLSFDTTFERECFIVYTEETIDNHPSGLGIFCFREDGLLVTTFTAFRMGRTVTNVVGYPLDQETMDAVTSLGNWG